MNTNEHNGIYHQHEIHPLPLILPFYFIAVPFNKCIDEDKYNKNLRMMRLNGRVYRHTDIHTQSHCYS